MNQSENLYDKLNNVHASLRKQKEDAFRTKQLAEQRLAIQKQDREGVEKKGADTRAKLRTLKERAVEMKNVNGVNEAENKQFEKEVRSIMLGLWLLGRNYDESSIDIEVLKGAFALFIC